MLTIAASPRLGVCPHRRAPEPSGRTLEDMGGSRLGSDAGAGSRRHGCNAGRTSPEREPRGKPHLEAGAPRTVTGRWRARCAHRLVRSSTPCRGPIPRPRAPWRPVTPSRGVSREVWAPTSSTSTTTALLDGAGGIGISTPVRSRRQRGHLNRSSWSGPNQATQPQGRSALAWNRSPTADDVRAAARVGVPGVHRRTGRAPGGEHRGGLERLEHAATPRT